MRYKSALAKSRLCFLFVDLSLALIPSRRCVSDPLIHHGRHFGRTLHAMSNVHVLITNGILRMGELADQPEETFTAEFVISFHSLVLY
jgi:hypothetical protein